MVRDFHEKNARDFSEWTHKWKTDTIQGIIFEKDSIKINGSKVDRNCSFSKIDQESKGNAFQVLQEVEQQVVQANFSESAVGGLSHQLYHNSVCSHYSAVRITTPRLPSIWNRCKRKNERREAG